MNEPGTDAPPVAAAIKLEVEAQGREWTRQRLQEEADRHDDDGAAIAQWVHRGAVNYARDGRNKCWLGSPD